VILIQAGKLLYDGGLAQLGARLAPFKLLRLTLAAGHLLEVLPPGVDIISREEGDGATGLTLRIPRARTAAVTADLLGALPVVDLAVEEPPIEAVIDQIYKGGGL
jgi:ABC-2 type transport system ATP-binding protein